MPPTLSPRRRALLATCVLIEGCVLLGFSWVLPWRADGLLLFIAGFLFSVHLAVAVGALGRQDWLPRAARLCAWSCLAAFSAAVLQVLLWTAHLARLYQEVGWTVAGGLFVFLCAFALFLVPLPLFLLLQFSSAAGQARKLTGSKAKTVGATGAIGTLALIPWLFHPLPAQASDSSPSISAEQIEGLFASKLKRRKTKKGKPNKSPPSLWSSHPVDCPELSQGADEVWAVTYRDKKDTKTRCFGGSRKSKEESIAQLLDHSSQQGIVIDQLRRRGTVDQASTLLSALSLRPGLDGVCSKKSCLLPWQLLGGQKYVAFRPLKTVPEARFGVDLEALADQLGAKESEALHVFSTESFFLYLGSSDIPQVRRVQRLGPGAQRADEQNTRRAQDLAARYIIGAQNKDGSFRYTLNPFSGKKNNKKLVLPRHGGTTLVLCELSRKRRSLDKTIARATRLIESRYTHSGELGYFTTKKNPRVIKYGETMLPLIALLECHRAKKAQLFDQWPSVVRFLLEQQREDGSFFPEFDLEAKRPRGDRELVFAAGQAIYALVLAEEHLTGLKKRSRKQEQLLIRVRGAADRAMSYYSGQYWKSAPYAFFFLEENWHCIAARAALRIHRHDDYERFCLDYVSFKKRFVQTSPTQGFAGGVTLSPLFPPHATATSGFGETVAAALAVAQARNEPRPDLESTLELSLGYLVQIQLRAESCFACKTKRAYGGFTESPVSGPIRIDFVQHALAALTHGREVLGWKKSG